MSNANLASLLAELEPVQRHRVMDLVEACGISVAGWAIKQGGLSVANPSANPAYCYEWAFGEAGEPIALCVWHDGLQVDGEAVDYRGNLRQLALRLEAKATDRWEPAKHRNRAKSQARRARDFDIRCQDAWREKLPVRFILLKGEQANDTELGRDSSLVEFRRLDPEPWHLSHYDMMTGEFRFVRGAVMATEADTDAGIDVGSVEDQATAEHAYVDQFDVVDSPERREIQGSAYVRSALVRAEVLTRAAGVCEACGEPGFRMANGAVYLETHHVVPLSQLGPDVAWNVVAVCANDHRVAHFGESRDEWRTRMIEHLSMCYPRVDVTRRLTDLVHAARSIRSRRCDQG